MVRDIKRYGNPACRERAIIQGPNCRFTVLTSSLIRMEYSENGSFEDRATQIVTVSYTHLTLPTTERV